VAQLRRAVASSGCAQPAPAAEGWWSDVGVEMRCEGSVRWSGGYSWGAQICDNQLMRADGKIDQKDEALRYRAGIGRCPLPTHSIAAMRPVGLHAASPRHGYPTLARYRYMAQKGFAAEFDEAMPQLGLRPIDYDRLESFYTNGKLMVDELVRRRAAPHLARFAKVTPRPGDMDMASRSHAL
jgi:hypothetical protein